MDSFLRAVERLATAKGITTLLVIALVGFFVWRNVDVISEVTFRIDRTPAERRADSVSAVRDSASHGFFQVQRAQLVPVDFKLPSAFYAEVENTGQQAGALELLADFGSASIEQFEVLPSQNVQILSGGTGANTLKLHIPHVSPEERVYLYALLTVPSVRALVATAVGGTRNSLTSSDLQTTGEARRSGFREFLTVLFGFFLTVMSIYFTVVLIRVLNRTFRMKWD